MADWQPIETVPKLGEDDYPHRIDLWNGSRNLYCYFDGEPGTFFERSYDFRWMRRVKWRPNDKFDVLNSGGCWQIEEIHDPTHWLIQKPPDD